MGRLTFALLVFSFTSPATFAQQLPWLGEGEKLTYALSVFNVVAATMELSAQNHPQGVELVLVATSTPSFSRIYSVNNRIETLLRRDPLSLLQQKASIQEGKRHYQERIVVDLEKGQALRTRDDQPREPVPVPFPVLDTLGAIFALRGFDLAPGRAFKLDVLSGKGVYPLLIVVTGRQTLKLPSGKVETLVVELRFRNEGSAKGGGTLTLFVSPDARHTPLRILSQLPFGSLSATLVDASPPGPLSGATMDTRKKQGVARWP
jgi:hypothetical protein